MWFSGSFPGAKGTPGRPPGEFGEGRPGWRAHPPGHGEHTREILQSLGIDAGTFDELRDLGII